MLDEETFDFFHGEAFITRVIRPVKSGKEARVVLCEGGASSPYPLVAVKEYAPIEERGFRNDAAYQHGMLAAVSARDKRALKAKSRHGLAVQEALWLGREWEHLNVLHEAGCSVPAPIASGPRSVAMEFVGSVDEAAPQLHRVRMDRSQAQRALDEIIRNVERMLAANLVHGDLSAFNVLWWNEAPVIIDLPQAIDARMNGNADAMLARDVQNICRHFERLGVRSDPGRIAHGLWMGFLFADL